MFNILLDIIYPRCCISCKRSIDNNHSDAIICTDCLDSIEMNLPPFCKKCGRHLEHKNLNTEICAECQKKTLHFERNWSACNYSNKMKDLLHLFKYNNKTKLRKVFGKLLIKFIQDFNIPVEKFDHIIPMPLHPTRLREREYNQTQLLTEELSKALSLKTSRNTISRIRNTKPQSSLSAWERWENIRGAFKVKNPEQINKKDILIIDDLYTTGATSSEIALSLKNAGAKEVSILTLAIAK